MKKSILNFGKALSKADQKTINGGFSTCAGFGSYIVNSCSKCINKILPGAPVACFNNCCIQAY